MKSTKEKTVYVGWKGMKDDALVAVRAAYIKTLINFSKGSLNNFSSILLILNL